MKALQETCALLEHNAKEGIWSAEMLPEIREVNLTLALALARARALARDLASVPAPGTGACGPSQAGVSCSLGFISPRR